MIADGRGISIHAIYVPFYRILRLQCYRVKYFSVLHGFLFDILDETDRNITENPVLKVVRTGVSTFFIYGSKSASQWELAWHLAQQGISQWEKTFHMQYFL